MIAEMSLGNTMICEVCGAEFGDLILNLGSHPLCDDLTPIGSNINVPKYDQIISLCANCLTAHQMVPVEKELLFKPSYHYRAALTKDVLDGMSSLVRDVIPLFSDVASKPVVLDIGCNDGSLLGLFKEFAGCTTIGVDPTGAILESDSNMDHKFNEYFTEQTAKSIHATFPNIDLITFTNVFAHIENLPQLLANLRILISDKTSLVIENHYLGAILDRNQFDTFYHEHPRTYSLKSFEFIARTLGLSITKVDFPSRYGGNIRVTLNKAESEVELSNISTRETEFIDSFKSLQSKYDTWKIESQKVLAELLAKGGVYGKALPGRAVMLINSLGINEQHMPIIFEQPNSPKVGNYVPSSRIEVLSDGELMSHNPQALIVWSWHIIDEIVKYLDSLGYRGEIWVPLPNFHLHRAAL